MTPHYCFTAALALVLLLAGCAHRGPTSQAQSSDEKPAGAHLGKSQAIQIAKRAVERFGTKLSEYEEPTASYRPSDLKTFSIPVVEGPEETPPGDHIWVVYFGGVHTRNYPGGDFFVFVDDKTGRSKLSGGM